MTLERLAKELPGATLGLLRRGRLISSVAPDQYVLHLPGSAATKQISKRFLSLVERALSDVVGVKTVRVMIQPTASKSVKETEAHESLFPDAEEAPLPVAVEAIPPRITRPTEPQRPLRNGNGGYANNHGGAATSALAASAPPRQRFGPPPP
ncbi:MAG: hypothetical protein H0X24_04420, partial [Ktedonobacterales bacterium]|nr:hypothetical protein [Ktedonobacterales bacterium]